MNLKTTHAPEAQSCELRRRYKGETTMDTAMTYDKLYSNMVKNFTVEKNRKDYKLGDYMLMKAKVKKHSDETEKVATTALTVRQSFGNSLVSFAAYVNDKLIVKEAPIRDRTIRKFPFRTSLSALCSAVLICTLIISCTVFGIQANGSNSNTVNAEYSESVEETENTATSSDITYTEQ